MKHMDVDDVPPRPVRSTAHGDSEGDATVMEGADERGNPGEEARAESGDGMRAYAARLASARLASDAVRPRAFIAGAEALTASRLGRAAAGGERLSALQDDPSRRVHAC